MVKKLDVFMSTSNLSERQQHQLSYLITSKINQCKDQFSQLNENLIQLTTEKGKKKH